LSATNGAARHVRAGYIHRNHDVTYPRAMLTNGTLPTRSHPHDRRPSSSCRDEQAFGIKNTGRGDDATPGVSSTQADLRRSAGRPIGFINS